MRRNEICLISCPKCKKRIPAFRIENENLRIVCNCSRSFVISVNVYANFVRNNFYKEEKDENENFCVLHKNKPSFYFCEQCEELICAMCVQLNHSSHKTEKISKLCESKIEKLNKCENNDKNPFCYLYYICLQNINTLRINRNINLVNFALDLLQMISEQASSSEKTHKIQKNLNCKKSFFILYKLKYIKRQNMQMINIIKPNSLYDDTIIKSITFITFNIFAINYLDNATYTQKCTSRVELIELPSQCSICELYLAKNIITKIASVTIENISYLLLATKNGNVRMYIFPNKNAFHVLCDISSDIINIFICEQMRCFAIVTHEGFTFYTLKGDFIKEKEENELTFAKFDDKLNILFTFFRDKIIIYALKLKSELEIENIAAIDGLYLSANALSKHKFITISHLCEIKLWHKNSFTENVKCEITFQHLSSNLLLNTHVFQNNSLLLIFNDAIEVLDFNCKMRINSASMTNKNESKKQIKLNLITTNFKYNQNNIKCAYILLHTMNKIIMLQYYE